jgi:hypothetical protein
MALAVTIGLVSLIAILAVATLSLASRLLQDSSLGVRDARLDGAVGFGLASAIDEWRARGIGRLAVGASVRFSVAVRGVPVTTTVSVTRVGADVFWVVSQAGSGQAVRRENLLLRRRLPDPQSLLAEDSTNVESLGFLSIDSIAATADVVLPGGAVLAPPGGLVHISGNATLLGGKSAGILIVDGVLTIAGPLEFAGIIVAGGGVVLASPSVSLTGMLRAAPYPADLSIMTVSRSEASIQDVMSQSLMPLPVAGRRWAELY